MPETIEDVGVNYERGGEPTIGETLWGNVLTGVPYGPKFKRDSQDNGGHPFEIVSVKDGEPNQWSAHGKDWDTFRCNLEARESGSQPVSRPAQPAAANAQSAKPTQAASREDYWQEKAKKDDVSQARMGRAHAQEMALRAMALLKDERNFGEDPPEDGGPNFDQIVTLWTDHFHKDVQRFPLDDDKIPF